VSLADHRELKRQIVDPGRLRRPRAREAEHERALGGGGGLCAVALAYGCECAPRKLGAGLGHRYATPTATSRNRAGAVPCETRIICPGSPLPQLTTPHSRHSGAEQTASSPAQNSGVTPA